MSLVSLLATTTLITLATSTPMILADDAPAAGTIGGGSIGQKAKIPVDHEYFLLIMLLNRKDFDLKAKPPLDETGEEYITSFDSDMSSGVDGGFDTGGIAVNDLTRDKRIGSLSIVNSVDVLRQRVLLELARRKAMEDQRQISENRRILNSVGKRSGGFSYRDHRIARKKRLQYQLDQQQPERLLAQ